MMSTSAAREPTEAPGETAIPPGVAPKPWRLWWLGAALSAIWAGITLVDRVAGDAAPRGTRGVALAAWISEDLARAHPATFGRFRPFAAGDRVDRADPPLGPEGIEAGLVRIRDVAPPEARAAIEALWLAYASGADAGRRAWSERGEAPLDPALVMEVERRLQASDR